MFITEPTPQELRKRIMEAARNEKSGLLIIPLGVFITFAGLIFSVIWSSGLAIFAGFFVVALGIFSTFFGFFLTAHYAHRYNDLLRELERQLSW
jgi:uncharacterized membrane protein